MRAQEAKPTFVYVGSYTKNPPGGGSNNPVGLSVFRLNPTSGALAPIQEVPSANPSFVALDRTRRYLYVVNEINDFEGQRAGSAEAYAINATTGEITLLSRQSIKGPIRAHLDVDPTGRYLDVANYVGGNFVVLPIESDGRLAPVIGEIVDNGHGPNAQRQASPHPHGITFDPAGRFLATADLGTDEIQIFQLANGKLVPISRACTGSGACPRAHRLSAQWAGHLRHQRAQRDRHLVCLRPGQRRDRAGAADHFHRAARVQRSKEHS